MYMPFLGNAGELSHIFASTLGKEGDSNDRSVSIDGPISATNFRVEAISVTEISPTLQSVVESDNSSDITIELSNAASLVATGSITAGSVIAGSITANNFIGNGSNLTNVSSSNLIGTISVDRIGNQSISSDKLINNTLTTEKFANYTITGVKIANSTVTVDNLSPGAVTTDKIGDGNVTTIKFANGAVTTNKIADNAITTSKIADNVVTDDKLSVNSVSTSSIKDENITTTKFANGAVTANKIADSAITTSKIANSAVNDDKLSLGAVTSDKIRDGNVTTNKYNDYSVVTDKIAALAITTSKITNGAVTTEKIADGNITEAKFANGVISTVKLVDGAVTAVKIANGTITGTQIQDASIPIEKLSTSNLTLGLVEDNSLAGSKIQRHGINGGSSTLTGNSRSEIALLTIHNDNIRNDTISGSEKIIDNSVTLSKLNSDVTLEGITTHGSTTTNPIHITNITGSSSKTTGALKVDGGLGVGGAVYATSFTGSINGSNIDSGSIGVDRLPDASTTARGVVQLNNATNSTSTTQAATANAVKSAYDRSSWSTGTFTSTTASSSKTTGAVVITGGLGVGGAVYATSFIGDGSGLTGVATTLQTVTSGSGNSSSNKILLTNSEDATSGQTGALQVTTGGLSVAKNIHVGKDVIVSGNLVVNGTTTTVDSTSLTVRDTIISLGQGNDSGSKDVGLIFGKFNSNVAIFYDISDSKLKFGLTNSDASSNQITLDETGNLPIDISGPVTATSFSGSIDGSNIDSGSIGVDRLPDASTSAQGVVQLNDLTTSTSTTQAATANAVKTAYDRSSWSTGSFTSATPSTSTGTGAVLITGGLGVGGAVYATSFSGSIDGDDIDSGTINVDRLPAATTSAQGVVQLNNAIDSSSTTQAATANAVRTAYDRSSWSTGVFTSTTDSTSTTSGALQVRGGLGVAKKIYAGDDITAFSDKRFKSNIERIESALDKVCQMGGYTFDHRGERKTGVLAQEVKEVLPEAVYGSEETTYSVAYGNLAGILIEAIKELRNEIQQLK